MNQEKRSLRDVTKIGLFSGLHYGNPGYREGLWHLAAEKFKQEQVDFIVLVGGLVDGKSLYLRLKEIHQQISCDHRRGEKSTIGEKKVEATIKFLEKTSQELAAKIPRIDNVKIYLITAPAYDKDIGQTIAERLAELRDDIWLYGQGDDRLQLKKINKILGVYAGKKAIWMRGDYYDTPILRVLKDEKKGGTEGLGDINVVGCLASAVHNPGDSSDIQKPYLSLPVLYKIDETRIAENQIGICILTFNSDLTDVAKEASDVILTDDNFTSIVNAVEEGRGIYDNIKKFVSYLLSSNTGEVLTIFVAIMLGLPLPLIAIMLLWNNLVTDGLPALALSVDPPDPDIMERKPRKSHERIISNPIIVRLLIVGFTIMISTLTIFYFYSVETYLAYAQTVALCTLMISQMFNVLNCRSEFNSLFKIGVFTNMKLWCAILVSVILQIIAVQTQ
ncbi:cation transporting ATPase C-terminal domain-containing protein, partial [Patescibacteria group bacterium]|nr:cation transporting ATPase C-terminal domain-containing protein [Patescibacteria group bacterium]